MSERLLIANMDSGSALKVLMATNKLSREEAANGIGCSETYLSTLCNRKSISGKALVEVCGFFGVTVSEYFKLGED